MSKKEYDLLLFGVTGFTGKLALEHLLEKNYKGLKFGVAARNESRAVNVVTSVCERLSERTGKSIDVIKALAPSTITSVIAPRPVVDVKLFKTLTYESNAAWTATNLQTDLTDGSPASIPATYFVQKEGEWFSFIRTNAGTVNFLERSANGIANNTAVDLKA